MVPSDEEKPLMRLIKDLGALSEHLSGPSVCCKIPHKCAIQVHTVRYMFDIGMHNLRHGLFKLKIRGKQDTRGLYKVAQRRWYLARLGRFSRLGRPSPLLGSFSFPGASFYPFESVGSSPSTSLKCWCDQLNLWR